MAIQTLGPQSGTAFELSRGDVLRVIDPEGEQVADLTAFNRNDINEWLSSGRTIDYANTIYLTTNHVLYSNRSRPLFTIIEDEVGRHDFLLTPCSAETFQIIYKDQGYHPSCFENLSTHLSRYGVTPDRIPTTFNIFMNVEVGDDGRLSILPPRSRAGQSICLRAEMDLIVGLTACSAEMSNNYKFKPIAYEVLGKGAARPD
ncbi:MAG TPA: urea carboxylase-associated family protein [Candidatus Udaeobacter sp.]|nr:urea carboxylase-associated family protein [Candidatus Udaeobacter sp.]